MSAPRWEDVEAEIERLAKSGEAFTTIQSGANRIASYHPGWRLQLETPAGPAWVDIEDIRTSWEMFQSLGRINRYDVMDPGRCSDFLMALFARLPGVVEEPGAQPHLVLSR